MNTLAALSLMAVAQIAAQDELAYPDYPDVVFKCGSGPSTCFGSNASGSTSISAALGRQKAIIISTWTMW